MLFNLKNQDDTQQQTAGTLLVLTREQLLEALQLVTGVIERRSTMAILSNVLIEVDASTLIITATDSDIELISYVELDSAFPNFKPITLSGRKLMDICRSLPVNSRIEFTSNKEGHITLLSGHSRFTLSSLPANEFPLIPEQEGVVNITIKQKYLKDLASKTYFAIPQQEVRTYLSGMLLEVKEGVAKAVASDTIRLAFNSILYSNKDNSFAQVIIPRKAVTEMMRFLPDQDDNIKISLNSSYIKISGRNFTFTSKLISGKFPNYNNHIPKNLDKRIVINRDALKQALMRTSILSHEILRGFRLILKNDVLQLLSNNPEHEEAVEEIAVDYTGESLDIAFNVSYLLDILNIIDTELVAINLKDGSKGMIIENVKEQDDFCGIYVLMPIRK